MVLRVLQKGAVGSGASPDSGLISDSLSGMFVGKEINQVATDR